MTTFEYMRYAVNYEEEVMRGTESGIMHIGDVYEFYGTAFEELFFNFYSFCRENLNRQSATENIVPNTFLFTNSFEVNAGAGLIGNQFLITINLGLLQSAVHNYYENETLEQYFLALYPNTISNYDNPVRILAFQVCTQFSYYHELAHLFQFSAKLNDAIIQERNDKEVDTGFDRTKHVLEINADTYASVALSAQIEQYISNTFQEKVTLENTMETVVFFGSCLLNYTINFSDNPDAIYFEQYTHPHSFIRLLNMLLVISHQLKQSPYFQERGIILHEGEVFLRVIDIYKNLEAEGIFKTNIGDIIEANKDLSNKLAEYLHSLTQFELEDYLDAMSIWNKQIVTD